MRWHHLPTVHHRQAFYERWVAICAFLILGELGLALQFVGAEARVDELASTGLPVGPILMGAAVIGILVSLVIFRTPHSGEAEL